MNGRVGGAGPKLQVPVPLGPGSVQLRVWNGRNALAEHREPGLALHPHLPGRVPDRGLPKKQAQPGSLVSSAALNLASGRHGFRVCGESLKYALNILGGRRACEMPWGQAPLNAMAACAALAPAPQPAGPAQNAATRAGPAQVEPWQRLIARQSTRQQAPAQGPAVKRMVFSARKNAGAR